MASVRHCTADENTRLENLATLALNTAPPTCPANCTVGGATDAPTTGCRNISPTTHVCEVTVTRTQVCTDPEEDNDSGVEDPLVFTLLLVVLASVAFLRFFRRV